MVVLSRRESAISQWDSRIEKAMKRLEGSKKCLLLFGDEDSKRYVEEDTSALQRLIEGKNKAIAFMDAENIL